MPRDHEPIVLAKFMGLWKRGDNESAPPDHFTDANNVKYVGMNAVASRDGLDVFQSGTDTPITKAKRMYNYTTQHDSTLLVLVEGGDIYHVVNPTTVHGPILSIADMEDFGFVAYDGRAYITPYKTELSGNGVPYQRGLTGEFLYVYMGDGTNARKAAGVPPTSGFTVANSGATGYTDAGIHLFAVVFEYDTGYLSAPGPVGGFQQLTTVALQGVTFTGIPTGGTGVVARRLVATKVIPVYDGNQNGYQFFFIPDGRIADNTTTSKTVSFFDQDLLDDASHLIDNFSEIAAGVALTIYHDKLCLAAQHDDISLIRVSAEGEPEAINQVNGLCIFPLDGNPITNLNELRDILYAFKKNRTAAFTDNGDVPSSWPMTPDDHAIGSPVHGIATVSDAGSSSIDYLTLLSNRGIELFQGRYLDPELSWKIRDFFASFDIAEFHLAQVISDPIRKLIYCLMPDGSLMIGDYNNGLSAQEIRWAPWTFTYPLTTIAIQADTTLVIGSAGNP